MFNRACVLFMSSVALLFAEVDHLTHWDGDEYHFHSEEQFAIARRVVRSLPLSGDESVLDIGCGDGKITAMINDMLPKGRVLGIDISPSMIDYAKRTFSKVPFEQMDAQMINFRGQFDLVCSFTAMQWVTNQEIALKGIYRALKSGGRFIVEMPQGLPPKLQTALDQVIENNWAEYFSGYSPNWRFYEASEYQSLLEDAGFEVESVTSREIPHTCPSKEAFIGFLKQWFPYLTKLPEEAKMDFLHEVVDAYSPDDGEVPFPVRRLNAVGIVR